MKYEAKSVKYDAQIRQKRHRIRKKPSQNREWTQKIEEREGEITNTGNGGFVEIEGRIKVTKDRGDWRENKSNKSKWNRGSHKKKETNGGVELFFSYKEDREIVCIQRNKNKTKKLM